jgi:hypothetical protein
MSDARLYGSARQRTLLPRTAAWQLWPAGPMLLDSANGWHLALLIRTFAMIGLLKCTHLTAFQYQAFSLMSQPARHNVARSAIEPGSPPLLLLHACDAAATAGLGWAGLRAWQGMTCAEAKDVAP